MEGPDCASETGPSAGNAPPEPIAGARGGVRVPPDPLADMAGYPAKTSGHSSDLCVLACRLNVLL